MARGYGQLKLVQSDSMSMTAYSASADPVARVFGEWLDWFGKSAGRCKLGGQRRQVINTALALYGEEMLVQAVIGAAADEWLAQQDGLGIEWILAGESRIERFADAGQRIQARALAQQTAAPVVPAAEPTEEQRQAAARARERMKAMVRRLSGRPADE